MTGNDSISEKTKQKLENLTKEIVEIKKTLRIGTTSLTPLNYMEEMNKFFESATYNPKYIYTKKELPNYTDRVGELKKIIEKLEIPQDLKEHLIEFLDDQNFLYLTKLNIGKKDFSEYADKLFDWGTDRLDLLLVNTPKVPFQIHISHKMQNAEQIRQRAEKALKNYNINSFEAKVDNFTPHIINVGHKTVKIGKDIRRYKCNVERLIVHEIESHVLQTENLKRSPTLLGELCKYGNMSLYSEGLAVYNEVTTRKITPSAFEMYYSRIKAVRMLHKSFREIYEILAETLTPQRAFVMTYRVKRGLSDTSQPGGFPKDAAYLLGYHEIDTMVKAGFPKDLLYATKSPVLSALLAKYNLIDTKNILTPHFYK
jgi:hypothetical protein